MNAKIPDRFCILEWVTWKFIVTPCEYFLTWCQDNLESAMIAPESNYLVLTDMTDNDRLLVKLRWDF